MCAMYGCPVDASAEPIEPSSRTLRVIAFQRRTNGIGLLPPAGGISEAGFCIVLLVDISPSITAGRVRICTPPSPCVCAKSSKCRGYFFVWQSCTSYVLKLNGLLSCVHD